MKSALRVGAFLLLLAVVAGLVFYRYPLWVGDQEIRFHLWREGVKSEYVEAGGYRLHYFEASPGNGGGGTPLVLVHGLGARGEDWAAMIPSLAAQGFHVYVPDLLGYGRSPKPDVDYSISLEEQTVVQFMQAMHVPRGRRRWLVDGWMDCDEADAGSSGDGGPAGDLRQRRNLFSCDVGAGVIYSERYCWGKQADSDADAKAAPAAELCG